MDDNTSYVEFDGIDDFIEIPSSSDFSVATTGQLAVSLWIRPAALVFPNTEGGEQRYVHFAGKGENDQQEWTFRIYSDDNKVGRANRISFYVFNPEGHRGIGSYFQSLDHPVVAGEWLHVLGQADGTNVQIFVNAIPGELQEYGVTIVPQAGDAPLRIGTRDFNSYFQGDIAEVRIWNRTLDPDEINALYTSGIAPAEGLVGEYLFSPNIAVDTAGGHQGTLNGATWVPHQT